MSFERISEILESLGFRACDVREYGPKGSTVRAVYERSGETLSVRHRTEPTESTVVYWDPALVKEKTEPKLKADLKLGPVRN